jgi:ABC-type polar amino acid transport system ATPase subunit
MASVELLNVAKQYGKQTVLHPLDLTIPDGSFTVLVGHPAAESQRCCACWPGWKACPRERY